MFYIQTEVRGSPAGHFPFVIILTEGSIILQKYWRPPKKPPQEAPKKALIRDFFCDIIDGSRYTYTDKNILEDSY